ncbi:MAG: ABC transporter permease [Pseudobdellovibrionaceae bacterium]
MKPQQEGFRWRRARAMALKEVAHILRDKFTLIMALVLPVVIVSIFGLAIEFNLNQLPTIYLDSDKTPSSRLLVEKFGSSHFFEMSPVWQVREGMERIESEKAKGFVIIPPQFEKDLLSGRGAEVQVLVDAADNASASSMLGYLSSIQARAAEAITDLKPPSPLRLESRFLFNPELNSKWFTVPGLTVILMTMLALLLTALTIAREWETGSMELLLSTPVQPLEIIFGKLAPYGILCLGSVVMVYGVARLGFGVPFRGSHLVYLFGTALFLITYLAQGLMLSVLTRKQMLAMQAALLSGLLPSQLLSGFIFPIENMPKFFQYFTALLPARWYMVISRASFLQGSSFWELRHAFLGLSLIGALFITISVKRFKRDVEP